MNFCDNCGSKLEENSKFCDNCGVAIEDSVNENLDSQNNSDNVQNNSDNSKKRKPFGIWKFIVIGIVVVALIVCAVAYVVFQKSVIPALKADSAKEMADKLSSYGLPVKVVKKVSPLKKGDLVEVKGVKEGEKVDRSRKVTVVESLGPGVPEGVNKMSLNKALKVLKSMKVPVKVHKAIATKPGKIVGSYPMPGNPIIEHSERVINVLVGSEGRGVPADLYGMDSNKAKDILSKYGFKNISLVPKLSSRKNIGKIIGSNPSLGSQTNSDTVTLYFGAGVDKKMFIREDKDFDGSTVYLAENPDPFDGLWCTNSGDCLDFVSKIKYPGTNFKMVELHGSHERDYLNLRKADNVASFEGLGLNNELNMCVTNQTFMGCDLNPALGEKSWMKNHLIFGDTGAVELYRGGAEKFCGNSMFDSITGYSCVGGKIDKNYENEEENKKNPEYNHKMSFRMADFYVIFPVGADLKKLEADGYFQGIGKHEPDMNRPFILRRDPKLYKKTQINIPPEDVNSMSLFNPFIPTRESKPVKFAPAPDDDNAYYLVEKPFDMSKLPIENQ